MQSRIYNLCAFCFHWGVDRPLMRRTLSRAGYVLVGTSALVTALLWSRTCSLGGLHCFDGGYGLAVVLAQFGVVVGLICSFFGVGVARLVLVVVAVADLACVYRQLLVH